MLTRRARNKNNHIRKRVIDDYITPQKKRTRFKEDSDLDDDNNDDVLVIVNAPTPANQFIEIQIKMLLDEDTSKLQNILDVLLELRLHKSEHVDARKALENTNICQNLIKIMSLDDENSGELQSKVFLFAYHLTFVCGNTNSHQYFPRCFIEKDAIEAITKVMKQFPRNEIIQQRGCSLLANLTYSIDGDDDVIFTEELFHLSNSFTIICNAMKEFTENVKLQFGAIAILCDLIVEDPSRSENDTVGQVTFIAPILDVLEKYYSNTALATNIIYFLWNVAERNQEDLKNHILERKATNLLAKVESYYKDDPENEVSKRAASVLKVIYK